MVRTPSRQRGLTFISLAIILAIIALIAMVVLKLVPVYLDAMAVSEAVTSLGQENNGPVTPGQIKDSLVKRFNINNIDSVTRDDIAVEQSGVGAYRVNVDYEVRVPFLYNIDFVVSFENQAEVGGGR